VSGPAPKTYVFETFLIAIVLIIAMVMFLKHSWGG
jgi:hypothetical protein